MASLIAVSVYFIKYLPVSNFVILPMQLVVGAAVFFGICEKFKVEEYVEVKGLADSYIKKIRKK
jgi:hypothetical protein